MIKHTLQEWSDFTGCYVAVDKSGYAYAYKSRPYMAKSSWQPSHPDNGVTWGIRSNFIEHDGDWRNSLTAPSEPPFKVGELVYGDSGEGPFIMNEDRMINSKWYRRPTEQEWRILRGE